MKTLMMSLMAAAFVLVAASLASANMMGSGHHSLNAIDPAGVASIEIREAASPVGFVKVYDKISLDPNNLWVVNDIYSDHTGYETIAEKVGMEGTEKTLLCFDSVSKFCAKAY